MENKERSGELTNERLERELNRDGAPERGHGYVGMQDTGDERVRQYGTEVQQKDGYIPENSDEKNKNEDSE